jgi:uncharacterized protein (DUF983 family)
MNHQPFYSGISPLRAGISGLCPRCGRGRLFAGYLAVAPACAICGLSFDFADAGDGAAWFVMLIAGFLAVGGVLFVEVNWKPDYWVHAVIATPLAVFLPLLLLRPAKGILLCQQYATQAREGRLD